MTESLLLSPQVQGKNATIFPGLRPFRANEAHLYHGRETYINEIKLKLTNSRFLTVIGSPESGKSSLLHAGLVPDLEKGFSVNGQSKWIDTHFIPRIDPISDLAHALAWVQGSPDLAEKDTFKQEMLDILNEGGSTGILKAYEKLIGNQERNPNLLIVVDQFDDFFTFYKKQKEDGKSDLAAQKFISQLLVAAQNAKYPIYIILSMRPEALVDVGQFPGLAEAINQGQTLLPNLTEKEIRSAISMPLRYVSETNPSLKDAVQGDSAERLAEEVWEKYCKEQSSPLSLIQLLLLSAWNKAKPRWGNPSVSDPAPFNIEDIDEGIEQVVSNHANAIFDELKIQDGGNQGDSTLSEQQQICKTLFQSLLRTAHEDEMKGGVVSFESIRELIVKPERTQIEAIEVVIGQYKKRLKKLLIEGQSKKKGKKGSQEEGVWFEEYWKKEDDIGRIISAESWEKRSNDTTPVGTDSIVQVIARFRDEEIGILQTFGETDLGFSEGETDILNNTHIQLANEILVDETYGWDKLKDWKRQEDKAANFYKQLLQDTRQNQSGGSLWEMPELGMGLQWIYGYQPTAQWAHQYDKQFGQGVGFGEAMDFLKRSVEGYSQKKTKGIKEQQDKIADFKRKNRWITIVAAVSILLALIAVGFYFYAERQKAEANQAWDRAFESKISAEASARNARKQEQKASIEHLKALDAKKTAEEERNRANSLKREAEAARIEAVSAKNEAEKTALLARAARLEAEAAKILAEIQERVANNQRDIAIAEKRKSDSLQTREEVRRSSLTLADQIDDGQLEFAQEKLKELYNDPVKGPIARQNREYYLALNKLLFSTRPEFSFAFTDGGEIRAMTRLPGDSSQFMLAAENGQMELVDVTNGDLKQGIVLDPLLGGKHIRSLAMDKRAGYLAVGTWEGDVIMYKYDLSNKNKQLKEVQRKSYGEWTGIRHLEFLDDNGGDSKLLVQIGDLKGSQGDSVQIVTFNGKQFKESKSLNLGDNVGKIDVVTFDKREGKEEGKLYIACRNRSVYIYDINSDQVISSLDLSRKFNSHITAMNLISIHSPTVRQQLGSAKKLLALGLENGDIQVYKDSLLSNKKPGFALLLKRQNEHFSRISSFDFYEDIKNEKLFLAVSSYDHTGKILDINNLYGVDKRGELPNDILLLKIHNNWIHELQFANKGKQILTISEDGTAKLWFTTVEETYNTLFLNQ